MRYPHRPDLLLVILLVMLALMVRPHLVARWQLPALRLPKFLFHRHPQGLQRGKEDGLCDLCN